MKLIWHIIRKDLVRDRWALALWAGLFLAQVVIGLVLLHDAGADRAFPVKMQVASASLVIAEFVAGYVLVVRLVHADLLFGTEMFWATRPISRGRLLAAKAGAALLVFGLLPVLLLAPWWLWCGFTARDLFWAAVETFGWQLLLIAPAFLVATLTNELPRTLMWTVLLFIGVMSWVALLGNSFRPSRGAADALGAAANGVAYSRLWLFAVLAVVLSGMIAAHHYLTGRLSRSILLTVASTGVVVAVGLFAPWNLRDTILFWPRPGPPPEIAAALPAVQARSGASMPSERLEMQNARRVTDRALNTEIYFEGLPAETAVSAGTSRVTWRWPDGMAVRRWSYVSTGFLPVEAMLRRTFSLAKPVDDPETLAAYRAHLAKLDAERQAKGLPQRRPVKILPPSQPGARLLLYSQVPAGLPDRAQRGAPAFEATLDCALSRPVILTELPLQAGAQGGRDSMRARLMWLGDQAGGKAASLLVTAPAQRQSGLWAVNLFARDWMNLGHGEIWLVNRSNGDCYRTGNYSLLGSSMVLVGGVALSWNQVRVDSARMWRNDKPVDRDPQWAAHSSLVVVAEEIVARFTARVQTERQEFKPSLWVDQTDPKPPGY